MLKIWKTKKKVLAKKNEAEQTAEFFQTFLHTAFFIHGIRMISYDVKDDLTLSIRQQVELLLLELVSKSGFDYCNISDYATICGCIE